MGTDFAAEQRPGFRWLHGEQAHVRVHRAECLADPDQRTAGTDAHHQGIGHHAGWQLAKDLGAEHLAILLDVPFGFELTRAEVVG